MPLNCITARSKKYHRCSGRILFAKNASFIQEIFVFIKIYILSYLDRKSKLSFELGDPRNGFKLKSDLSSSVSRAVYRISVWSIVKLLKCI